MQVWFSVLSTDMTERLLFIIPRVCNFSWLPWQHDATVLVTSCCATHVGLMDKSASRILSWILRWMVDEECAPTWLWLNGDLMVFGCPYPIPAGVNCAVQAPDYIALTYVAEEAVAFYTSNSNFVGCFAQVGHVLSVFGIWSAVMILTNVVFLLQVLYSELMVIISRIYLRFILGHMDSYSSYRHGVVWLLDPQAITWCERYSVMSLETNARRGRGNLSWQDNVFIFCF